ncbi:MAG: MBL fold metallo-hydrolase [Candidatus Hodarchaeales archaeon]
MVFSTISSSYFDEFPFRRRDKRRRSSGYFFLSHAHSDHTSGLKSITSDPDSILVCSSETAAVVQSLYKIPKDKILILDSGQYLDFDDFVVHAINANHCVGSLLFVIESKEGPKEVYTGDFRLGQPILEELELIKGADRLWVDYTYGKNPIYEFPPRDEMISEIITLMLQSQNYPQRDVWIAAYQIGKEKLLKTISQALKIKLWAPESKVATYKRIGGEWDIFCNEEDSGIYIDSRRVVEDLVGVKEEYKSYMLDSLRISPTGWAVRLKKKRLDVHFFPYSDHCSYSEVHKFIELAKAKEIIKI